MFTVPPTASEDELNARIPLSVVRWHKHTNFCAAPADRVKEYLGKHPKFGMFGSINTADACKAEGGTFYPGHLHVDDSRVSIRERSEGRLLDERRHSALWVNKLTAK